VKTKKTSKREERKEGHPKRANAAHKGKGKEAAAAPDQLLTGWPTIARYLGQPVTVAQRWAKDGMPVEREGRSMTARAEELSKWLGKEAGVQSPLHIAQSSDEDLLTNLRRGLKDARTSKRK
jgi:hypothetical protein